MRFSRRKREDINPFSLREGKLERPNGKPRPASDQYALGVVVYEWLCGEPPFSEGNFMQLGYQHSYVAPPPLSKSLPTIAPTVEQVVLRALAKDPAQRWPSVQAFAEALENAKEHD